MRKELKKIRTNVKVNIKKAKPQEFFMVYKL